jgi:hypothetical protein
MAHWAKINSENIVEQVIAVSNDKPNEGADWVIETFGGVWVQTSYNTLGGHHLLGGTPMRKNYAGIGYTFDEQRDAFIPPRPFASWILNESSCLWEAPVPYPNDGKTYSWDEAIANWYELPIEE